VCVIARRCAWVLGLWLFVAPPAAGASTVSSIRGVDEGGRYYYAKFSATRGERNRLTVRTRHTSSFRGVVIRDTGSRVRARGRCESLDRHSAKCAATYGQASISLGDLNDRVDLLGSVSGGVHGGAGNDLMIGRSRWGGNFFGGKGNDVLRGGAEDDVLDGGPGRDRLYGAGGDDTLIDGETDAQAAPDLFDGGRGSGAEGDTVDFRRRDSALRIDLERGLASTGDTIVRVRNVAGGSGDDVLTGDAVGNTLDGGLGDDAIDGGSGNDLELGGLGDDRLSGGVGNDDLIAHGGRDRLDGGAGDDVFFTNEATDGSSAGTPILPDEVACGDGADAAVSDASDTLERACDQLWPGRSGSGPPRRCARIAPSSPRPGPRGLTRRGAAR
jgi:hypothetical protein